jgi:hypothetical protein
MAQQNFARNKFKCSGGTGVEHLTHFPKVEGLNPTTGSERDKKWTKKFREKQNQTSSWHRGRTLDSFS